MNERGQRIKVGFLTERMLLGFGVDLVIDRIAGGLCQKGHDVTVYPSLTDGTYESAAYKIKPIPTPAISFFPAYDRNARRWLDFLNKEEIDLYLVSTFPFFSLIPRLDKPCVAIDYGVCSTEGFSIDLKANFAYMKWTQQHRYFTRAKRIITISEFVKSLLPKSVQSKTEVIYIGADHYIDDWIRRGRPSQEVDKFRGANNVSANDILLVYVGRLNPEGQPYKGTKQLMELFHDVMAADPKIKTMMVGYGDENDKTMIQDYGIIPCVKAPVELMPVIYAAADIYVTASRWEGFDLPLAEAESFSKPGVALDIGAHREVAADSKTAFLTDSVDEMRDKVLMLCRDDSLRVNMGEAASEYVEKFKWQRVVDDYDTMIKEVLA